MTEKNTKNPSENDRERRNFFRVDEDIVLDFRVVETSIASIEDPDTQFSDTPMLELFSSLRRVDGENSQLLPAISDQNRHIADYLANINKKFDLLAQHLATDKNENNQMQTTHVNLSEEGVAFGSDKAIYKGSYLALRLLFIPSYVSVALFARVVRSKTKNDKRYHLAAKFHRLQDQQRQVLSKHIMQNQLSAKRRIKE